MRDFTLKMQMRSRGGGIYYNATHMEAQLCDSEEVIVVGGGNSAGQAAVFLAQSSAKVHLFVRSQKLSDSMSQYLIGRIEAHPKIEIHFRTRITGLSGAGHLEHVEWRDDALGVETHQEIPKVPTIFLKLTSALNGPHSTVVLPKLTQQPDYEAEFAFVIGKGGKDISADRWQEHVFGYTIMNDVSARDTQMSTSQ